MSVLAHWTHDLSPYLVRFPESFPLDGIRFYGFAYLIGFLAAAALFVLYRKKGRSPIEKGGEIDLLTYLLIGVIVGGRLGYVLFYDAAAFVENPLILFQVWKGGMASHGGILGVAVALALYARNKQIAFFRLSDMVMSAAPLGLFFGRLANFVNGELWGTRSQVAWAVIFPGSPPDPATGLPEPRHPSQIYQAMGEGLLLFAWLQWRFWRNPGLTPGRLTAECLIGYGALRFLAEFFREPDASLIFGLSRGQFYSLPLIMAGVVLLLILKRGTPETGDPSPKPHTGTVK